MAEAADFGRDLGESIDAGRGELLKVLLRHEAKFVVIGGAAIQSHGRRHVTEDIDLTPDTEAGNRHRLANALNQLECRLVTEPADPSGWVALLAGYFTPRSLLGASVWNLATRHGLLDLSFTPSGSPGGYADLAPHATTMPPAGTSTSVLIASLDDVHASKRAADRAKDRTHFAASQERDRWQLSPRSHSARRRHELDVPRRSAKHLTRLELPSGRPAVQEIPRDPWAPPNPPGGQGPSCRGSNACRQPVRCRAHTSNRCGTRDLRREGTHSFRVAH